VRRTSSARKRVRCREAVPAMHLAGIKVEQTVQLSLDLGVRGPETGGDEVDHQPCKAPIRYPAPYRTELAKDAVRPLQIREFSGGIKPCGPATLTRGSSCRVTDSP
jgi:hypothetical protein